MPRAQCVAMAALLFAACSVDLAPLETNPADAGADGGVDASDASTGSDASDAPIVVNPDAPVVPNGATCAEILNGFPKASNGRYTLSQPESEAGAATDIEAYCDMTGGGWTLAFVSSKTTTNKGEVADFYLGTGLSSLAAATGPTAANMYAIEGFGTRFHRAGVELRLTWLCDVNLTLAELLGAEFAQLTSGTASWLDQRPSVVGVLGTTNGLITNMAVTGDTCWGAAVVMTAAYAFSIGNGSGFGSYIGWNRHPGENSSTAISQGGFDNRDGSVAGWFR